MKFTMNFRCGVRIGTGLLALMLAACTSQMEPARTALTGAQNALQAAGADAQKYVPEQYAATQTKVQALQYSFEKQDFAAVIAGAPQVVAEAQALVPAAASKKQEVLQALSGEWAALTASMPKLLDTVQKRVAAALKGARLPEGADLQTAELNATNAAVMWGQAQAAGASGRVESAVATARKARERLETAAAALKLTLPAS